MADEETTDEETEEEEQEEASEDGNNDNDSDDASADAEEDDEDEGEAVSIEDSDESMEEVEVPEQFKDLVETIEQMPVLELAELVKVLEKKFGVSAAVAAAPAAGGGGDADDGGQDSFTVELTEAGSSKIQVIKAVKEITGKGLKDAKGIVDDAPVAIAEGVSDSEADDLKAKLEEAGATVTLK